MNSDTSHQRIFHEACIFKTEIYFLSPLVPQQMKSRVYKNLPQGVWNTILAKSPTPLIGPG